MFRIVEAKALANYHVYLRFSDGAEGEVDLSDLVGKGVFQLWDDAEAFKEDSIGPGGEIRWSDQVDLCPDALYLQITGKSPEEIFPNLRKARADA